MTSCKSPDCASQADKKAAGFCVKHSKERRRRAKGVTPLPPITQCQAPGCKKQGRYHFGHCKKHLEALRWREDLVANREKGRAVAKRVTSKFSALKSTAKVTERELTISFEEFVILNSQPCHYCNGPLPKTGHGLDRLDNTRGYHLDNVVPCCTPCNLLRGNRLTPEETRVAILAIQQFRAQTHETQRSLKIIKG